MLIRIVNLVVLQPARVRASLFKQSGGLDLVEFSQPIDGTGKDEGYDYRVCVLCDICQDPVRSRDPLGRVLAQDHCHKTGVGRGRLCHRCNLALGMFDDNIAWLEAAIAYLKHHAANPPPDIFAIARSLRRG